MEQLAELRLPRALGVCSGKLDGMPQRTGTTDARTHPSRPATLPRLDPVRQEDFRLGVPEDLNGCGEGTWRAREWAVATMVCV